MFCFRAKYGFECLKLTNKNELPVQLKHGLQNSEPDSEYLNIDDFAVK